MVHTLDTAKSPYPPSRTRMGREYAKNHNASETEYEKFLEPKKGIQEAYNRFIDGRDPTSVSYKEYNEYYQKKHGTHILDLTGDDKTRSQNGPAPSQSRAFPMTKSSNLSKPSAETSRSPSTMRITQPSRDSTSGTSHKSSGTKFDPLVLDSSDEDETPRPKVNSQPSRQQREFGSGTLRKFPMTVDSSKDTPKTSSYISPYSSSHDQKSAISSLSKDTEKSTSLQGSSPKSSFFRPPLNPFNSPPPPDSGIDANERPVEAVPPSSLSSQFGAQLKLSTSSQSEGNLTEMNAQKPDMVKSSLEEEAIGRSPVPPKHTLPRNTTSQELPAGVKELISNIEILLPNTKSSSAKEADNPPKSPESIFARFQKEKVKDRDPKGQENRQEKDRSRLQGPSIPVSTSTPHPSGRTEETAVQPSTSLTDSSKLKHNNPSLGSQLQMEPPHLKTEPVAKTAFPLELRPIETLLRDYVQECHEDQDEYVKFRFRKARLAQEEASKRATATVPRRSPFADMPALGDETLEGGTIPKIGRREFNNIWPPTPPLESSTRSLRVTAYEPSTLMPPKYSNYVSLQSNILSRNDAKLKYFPYFNDDFEIEKEKTELHKELHERFKDRIKDQPLRRKRFEQIEMYGPYIEDFMKEVGTSLDDILFYLLDPSNELPGIEMSFAAMKIWKNRDVHCEGLFDRSAKKWVLVYSKVDQVKPDKYHLALAGLVCAAFKKVCGFSIWELASRSPSANDTSDKERRRQADQSSGPSILDLRCTVCHVHNCPNHGAFLEHRSSGDEGDSSSDVDTDSNDDAGNNHRQRAIHAQSRITFSQRPAYQMGLTLAQYRGLADNGTLTGVYSNPPKKFQSDEGEEFCSSGCFWKKSNRRPAEANSKWSEKDLDNVRFALSAFINHPRGPCMIRNIVNTKPCWEIFNQILALAPQHEKSQKSPPKPWLQRKNPPKRKGSYWQKNSSTHNHELRKPFRPCSHDGSCEDADCRCFRDSVTCEPSCGCPDSCERRFQGCSCERRGLVCWQNQDKCDCYQLNRECDPMLCKTCGVYEVLDPVNRHNEAILDGRCHNTAIQRGVPKRTLIGRSEVQGWGLFAGQDIKADDFIGEYKGEVISRDESDRRGAVYHYRGLEYLFGVSDSQDIDGTRAGSKMRFINHSAKNDNCWAKKMLCNTIQRIGLFAKIDIKSGQELFFNYGYPEAVLKTFRERGDPRGDELNGDGVGAGPPKKNKEKAGRKQGYIYKLEGGKKKKGGKTGVRKKKTRGVGNEWFVKPKGKGKGKGKEQVSEAAESAANSGPNMQESKGKETETQEILPFPPMPPESSDEDMYEPDEDEEDSSGVESEPEPMDVDDDEGESSSDAGDGGGAKSEVADRRRGGLAQLAGWETRKRKMADGG